MIIYVLYTNSHITHYTLRIPQYKHVAYNYWLVVWNMFFPYVGNVIIPTDFHIFQRGRSTTNQIISFGAPRYSPQEGTLSLKGYVRGPGFRYARMDHGQPSCFMGR